MTGQFDHLLNWRLLQGAHDFPGPDGGTCINEAAVVAAGMPYRRIMGASDLPKCFSVPLSMFALGLNDAMDDEDRKRLMPFVMRLAGTIDTTPIEQERTDLILVQTARRIVAPLFRTAGFEAVAQDLEQVEQRAQLRATAMRKAISRIAKLQVSSLADRRSIRHRHSVKAAQQFGSAISALSHESRALRSAHTVGHAGCADYATAAQFWEAACEILDAACRIGRQPDPLAIPLIQERFEVARSSAPTPELVE